MSPVRPIPDDQERIARERERMVVGELGYGRVDSPVSGPPAVPRRPGSGHNQPRKAVAVVDLLTDKEPPPPPQVARPDSRNAHRIINSTSRRSPPGSHIGRAKAARKSDESRREQHIPPPPPKEPPILAEQTKIKEEPNIKQEPKPNRPRRVSDEIRRTPTVDDSRQKKPVKEAPPGPPPPPPPKLQPGSSKTKKQDDAHEYFLQQYDELPAPATKSARAEPLHMPSPAPHPITTNPTTTTTPSLHNTKSPSATQQQKALTPITAAVALERELEDLVAPPTSSRTVTVMSVAIPKVEKREESEDMDLAFDELVDTLEDSDKKDVGNGMEVDVDSELLSLVDDRPPPPTHVEDSSRRASGSSTLTSPISTSQVSNVAHSPFTPSVTAKQQQQVQRTTSDGHPTSKSIKTTSPVLTALLPSAISVPRQTSGRATSDRNSMPPPATTTKGGMKKAAERASSVVPPEPTSTASTAATTTTTKKKKETTSKVRLLLCNAIARTPIMICENCPFCR